MFLFGERFAFKRKHLSLYTSIYLFRFTFWSPAQKSGSRSHCKTPPSATHHQTQTNQSHLLWNDAENTSQDFECCFWIKSRKNKQANKKKHPLFFLLLLFWGFFMCENVEKITFVVFLGQIFTFFYLFTIQCIQIMFFKHYFMLNMICAHFIKVQVLDLGFWIPATQRRTIPKTPTSNFPAPPCERTNHHTNHLRFPSFLNAGISSATRNNWINYETAALQGL